MHLPRSEILFLMLCNASPGQPGQPPAQPATAAVIN